MATERNFFGDAWFFSPDGALVTAVPACEGRKNSIGRALLELAPRKPSVRRRLRRRGAERLVDSLGYMMHLFATQVVGAPPLKGWSLLRKEVERLEADRQLGASVSRLVATDDPLTQEGSTELLRAVRLELLVGLLSVHCMLSVAADKWDSANEFLAQLQQVSNNQDLPGWPIIWPISLRVNAAKHAPVEQRLTSLTSLLRDVQGPERPAVIAVAEALVLQTLRHLPDLVLVGLLAEADELSRACPESWPINRWLAGVHFREGERLAADQKHFAAANQFVQASACAPEFSDLRAWLFVQLQHLGSEQREQIEVELASPAFRVVEESRLKSKQLSIAPRLGMTMDEQGAEAASAWLAQAVEFGKLPTDAPPSLSRLTHVLGDGIDAAETWILSNIELDSSIPTADEARLVERWLAVIESHRRPDLGGIATSWASNRWLTTAEDIPVKLLATCGALALAFGITTWGHRAYNRHARNVAFEMAAEAWATGDTANTRQSARKFLQLLPVGSSDARAGTAASRLRLSTLQGIGALDSGDALVRAKEDLTLATLWIEQGATLSISEN